jgi:muramoyltetrapeptide carboxypeptidase
MGSFVACIQVAKLPELPMVRCERSLRQSLCVAVAFLIGTCAAAEPPSVPGAPGLRAGDTIAIVAPARGVNLEQLQRVKQVLEQRGYRVKHASDIGRRYGYLAGTDERRAEELMQAFLDPEVKAVFPFTGGYGTTRILERLDYAAIAANPKILIGFSDITGLHLALQAKAPIISFHSPNPDGGWGREQGMNPYAERWLWRAIEAIPNSAETGFTYDVPDPTEALTAMRPGKAAGRLTGGNLSLVAALMGTPFEIQTEGRVVFLEDVHEAPYRIDRYLSQLRLAGKLREPAAVVLGQFTDAGEHDEDGLTMEQVMRDYFQDAPYPVITNFPAGHVSYNATLPIGAMVEVDADRGIVRVLESPVRP